MEIRVLIADDEPEIRQALAELIASEPSMRVVASAGDADEAIAMAGRERPDVALVDVKMPGGGGAAAARGSAPARSGTSSRGRRPRTSSRRSDGPTGVRPPSRPT